MKLYYENSRGAIIDLMKFPVMAQNPEVLAERSWGYETETKQDGTKNIKQFYKDLEQKKLQLSIMADSKEEYNNLMNDMSEIFDYDVRNRQPGKIWWNDRYKEVYVTATDFSEYEEDFEAIENEITVSTTLPWWIKENHVEGHINNPETIGKDLDYPHDYAYDYFNSAENVRIYNDSIADCHFQLTIYGPCENPRLLIGNQIYGLNCSLDAGEYALIRSREKKAYKIKNTGERESILRFRDGEYYLFEKLHPGSFRIAWDGLFGFEMIAYEERSEPLWI